MLKVKNIYILMESQNECVCAPFYFHFNFLSLTAHITDLSIVHPFMRHTMSQRLLFSEMLRSDENKIRHFVSIYVCVSCTIDVVAKLICKCWLHFFYFFRSPRELSHSPVHFSAFNLTLPEFGKNLFFFGSCCLCGQ